MTFILLLNQYNVKQNKMVNKYIYYSLSKIWPCWTQQLLFELGSHQQMNCNVEGLKTLPK